MSAGTLIAERIEPRESRGSCDAEAVDSYGLLAAVSSPEGALDLESLSGMDWESLIAQARHHSLVPLLAHRLLECESSVFVPPKVRARLHVEFQENLIRNFHLLQEIKRVIAALGAVGVEALPYKGPVLAEQLWGSIALRECSDLDFLVRREDVERAGEVLMDIGYTRVSPVATALRPALLRNASEEQFRHTENKILLELQWAPAPRTLAVDYDENDIWQDVESTIVAGEQFRVPRPETQVGLLAIHGWKHNWSKLIWVADLAMLIRNSEIDWDVVYRSACEQGWRRILLLSLEMVRRVYKVETPVRADPGVCRLATDLECHLRSATNHNYVAWHRDMLRARDRRRDQIQQLTNFVFTPGLAEYSAAKLPDWGRSGYRGIRLARVAHLWPYKARE